MSKRASVGNDQLERVDEQGRLRGPSGQVEADSRSAEDGARATAEMMPALDGRAAASADENSNFDQYSAIKQTKRLQNTLTGVAQPNDNQAENQEGEFGVDGVGTVEPPVLHEDGSPSQFEVLNQEEVQPVLRPGGELMIDGPLGQQQELANAGQGLPVNSQ